MTPRSISRRDDTHLVIIWNDGSECVYPHALLRRSCPCATCTTEAASRAPGYIPLFTRDALSIDTVQPVGYYAVQIRWNDGHHTGIYTWDYLRELCPAPPVS